MSMSEYIHMVVTDNSTKKKVMGWFCYAWACLLILMKIGLAVERMLIELPAPTPCTPVTEIIIAKCTLNTQQCTNIDHISVITL